LAVARNLLQLRPKKIWIEDENGWLHTDYDAILRSSRSSRSSPILIHQHVEVRDVGKRPTEYVNAFPQQTRIVFDGTFLTNADQRHLFRDACFVHRQPHEHPCRGEGPFGIELVWASKTHRALTGIAKPFSPVMYCFV